METKKPFIYIISPYTHENEAIMDTRAYIVTHALSILLEMRPDAILFSPIVQYHQAAVYNPKIPRDAEHWRSVNMFYMELADEAIVVNMSDIKHSKGCKFEITWFLDNFIPISTIYGVIDGIPKLTEGISNLSL